MEGPLGRREPTDDRHVELYGLTASTMPSLPTHGVMGINWYENFDKPVAKTDHGRTVYYIGEGNLGRVRGGHAICCASPFITDSRNWWRFYNQGEEGACTGFASCRMQTGNNRKRYDGFKIYHRAQQIDEWPGEDYDGTSVRAAMDVLRTEGLWRSHSWGDSTGPYLDEGILQNRWGLDMNDVARTLSPQDNGLIILNRGWLELLNSWGEGYPWKVRMPLETAERIIFREHGEYTVVTDNPGPRNVGAA